MPPTTPATYRQRLTPIGWAGLVMALICPAASAAMGYSVLTSGPYVQPPAAWLVIACAVGTILAPVLILLGREYFPYEAPEPSVSREVPSAPRRPAGY